MHKVAVAGWVSLLASSALWGNSIIGIAGDPGGTAGDLFDVGLGTVVTAGSPVIDGCDLRDILGGVSGNNASGCESTGTVLFKDINSGPWPFGPTPPAGATNYYITFNTAATVHLTSYIVYLQDDFNQTANRTVSEFRLFLDDGAGAPRMLLSDVTLLGAGQTNYQSVYGNDSIALSASVVTTVGYQFSAVFTSNPLAGFDAGGPRVFELDGFGDGGDAPEPGTLALAGTATVVILLKRRRSGVYT